MKKYLYNDFTAAHVVEYSKGIHILITASIAINRAPAIRCVLDSDLSAKVGASVYDHI